MALKTLWVPWLAALFYGGWAAFSNSEHGASALLMAGLVQGGFAFLSTLLLTLCVTWLLIRQQKRLSAGGGDNLVVEQLPLSRLIVVFLQSSFFLAVTPALLHWFAGTPDIWQAMLPGLLIGNGYLLVLIRQQRPLAHSGAD